MIIFGKRFINAENLGKALYSRCTNCNKKTWKDLYRGRTWFALYYIPVIPLRKGYQLRCKYCNQDYDIKKGYVKSVLASCYFTQKLIEGKVSLEEYKEITATEIKSVPKAS